MSKNEEVRDGKAQLLDVRTLEEWNEGHAENAIHIPIDILIQGNTEPLRQDTKVYTYCHAGGRASRGAQYLVTQGFQAESVGGLSDWEMMDNGMQK